VWSLSRPLTYRAIEQLAARGYVHAIGEEPGIAGGNRTILAATRSGRAHLRKWLNTPVLHLRDLRSELLLKLVVAEICGVDITNMLQRQRDYIEQLSNGLLEHTQNGSHHPDVVALWRSESSRAALRFLDALGGSSS
jgi:PadR family transcriptional regulator AphA